MTSVSRVKGRGYCLDQVEVCRPTFIPVFISLYLNVKQYFPYNSSCVIVPRYSMQLSMMVIRVSPNAMFRGHVV